ncbi:hypothetical protein SAMN02745194_04109 [Roseomonas rosea]|uniref:Uncharacterized protein n=1 Tax=Muricoccus roseus TaxID=198092 RepID=A0A1M6PGU2_9PROT|nr:hypothetical protein SAMN02745194_04109 [Roseomonas rosea]
MAAARPAARFLCDAFFRIPEDVYVGPDHAITQEDWRGLRVPVPAPNLPLRMPGKVATTDLLGREEGLAEHGARLLEVAGAHGKAASMTRPSPYFTVAPAILGPDGLLATWPWSDTLPEAVLALEALAAADRAAPGTILWDDEDQGWHLRIIGAGASACLVEWDAEGPPPAEDAWRVDAAELAGQAASALERLRTVHARLVKRLGRDLWS